jgi:hypothetical protein
MSDGEEIEGIDPLLPDRNYVKKLLKNTLETYSLPYKALFEALQNAIDSFIIEDGGNLRWGTFPEGHEPQVDIFFDMKENRITVRDNGVGMESSKYGFFVLLGASGKDATLEEISDDGQPSVNRRKVKGSQGVGVKSAVFSSSWFFVESVFSDDTTNKSWSLELKDYHNYMKMDRKELHVHPPKVNESDKPTGTTVSVIIHPDVKPTLDSSNEKFTVKGFLRFMIGEQIRALGLKWNPNHNPQGVMDCPEGYTLNQDRTVCVKDDDQSKTEEPKFIGTWYAKDGSGTRFFPPLDSNMLILNYLKTQTYLGDMTRPIVQQRVLELQKEKEYLEGDILPDLELRKFQTEQKKKKGEIDEEEYQKSTQFLEENETKFSELLDNTKIQLESTTSNLSGKITVKVHIIKGEEKVE